MPVRINFFTSGYCIHPAKVVTNANSFRLQKFPAAWALLEHPQKGLFMFDTGYSRHFFHETRKFPYLIYKMITPVYFTQTESAIAQLAALGISPSDIQAIILSHFHADHISACADFPDTKFICSKPAFDRLRSKTGFAALKQGFLPGLLPGNFESRMHSFDGYPQVPLEGARALFQVGFDLLGDQSVLAVPLDGHAWGQYGLFVQTNRRDYFLIADAAWTAGSYLHGLRPHRIADWLFSDPAQYRLTLARLQAFHQQSPGTYMVPTHCSETLTPLLEQHHVG